MTIPCGGYSLHHAGTTESLATLMAGYARQEEKNFFLADAQTAVHCLPPVMERFARFDERAVIIIEAGEPGKTAATLEGIWHALLEGGAGRGSLLFNLGGGVVTDLGGFAASTFRRGIPFVNVPTTLLGMVDAAIGGKTAVNLGPVKNQAGTFAFPEAVIIHPPFLHTLPKDELLAGYAEMLKTAIVGGKELFDALLQMDAAAMGSDDFVRAPDGGLIMKAALLKAGICAQDPFDRGIRQVLNFGHSVGHALEALYHGRGQVLRHGYAVAAGMLCEAWMAVQLAGLPTEEHERMERYILDNFPATAYSNDDLPELARLMGYDKKNDCGELRLSLPQSIGSCRTGVACPEALVLESLSRYLEITKSRFR